MQETTSNSINHAAFKEQLATEEQNAASIGNNMPLTSLMSIPPDIPQMPDSRVSERKKVNGRAKIRCANTVYSGKMVDVSTSGASVLCEDLLPTKKVVDLEIDIFHEGRKCYFVVQAIAVYSVLVGGKGYKIGLQFGPLSPAAQKSLNDLIHSN